MTDNITPRDKYIKFSEPPMIPAPPRPMNTWKHLVAHICIWFLVIVLVMVYFTSTGSPQAGLLEVGISAFIFVALFHLIMKFFPLVSKIITSVIAIGFGIALVFVNYHYLKVVKTDATLKELLVGDLLVHKIVKTVQKEPITLLTKKEMPPPVRESKPEKPPTPVSFDQLNMIIAEPLTSDMNAGVLQVTSVEPAIKTKTLAPHEKYTLHSLTSNMPGEIARLPFTVKDCEPAIQHVAERNDLNYAILPGALQDTPHTELNERKIRPPLSEKAVSIPIQ